MGIGNALTLIFWVDTTNAPSIEDANSPTASAYAKSLQDKIDNPSWLTLGIAIILPGPGGKKTWLEKVWNLIPWSLKKSPSYHTPYAEITLDALNNLVREGDIKAKKMLKLIKESSRLIEKIKNNK